MEKVIILAIVFTSLGFLIRKIIRIFREKDSCYSCANLEKCERVRACDL